jgi:formate--tetrahydrofolate ligase
MYQPAILPITELASALGIDPGHVVTYGKYKAKLDMPVLDEAKLHRGKLILVTSITPTKAGNGKTTTSIGLADGLRRIGKKAVLALREPSLGPCFGMKGGATGAGGSQLFPAEEINLHFTGDFHAVSSANNMLAALLDNHLYYRHGNGDQIKVNLWRRVLDVNDRSLRFVITGLHGGKNGIPQETGFDITPASELMAILCLSRDLADLRHRIDSILLGFSGDSRPFTTRDLGVSGSIAALLKDALLPNLVQTLEGTPALVHGGPFANIAHGCNSLLATRTALQLGDYVLTEAGFGSDLGAEKFFNIKCRLSGLTPALSVLVVTTASLKLHGGISHTHVHEADAAALKKGFRNLERHLAILHGFGQRALVTLNRFASDPDEEIGLIRDWCGDRQVPFAVNDAHARGGEGAMDAARLIEQLSGEPSAPVSFTYNLADSVEQKLQKIATRIYGARDIFLDKKARQQLKLIDKLGIGQLPICVAKTQYSFTENPDAVHEYGPHTLTIDDLLLNTGAGFIVAVCGEMMRMPGLPQHPAAEHIDMDRGRITGLS